MNFSTRVEHFLHVNARKSFGVIAVNGTPSGSALAEEEDEEEESEEQKREPRVSLKRFDCDSVDPLTTRDKRSECVARDPLMTLGPGK